MQKNLLWAPLIGSILVALNACSSPQKAFLTVQLCLVDQQGVDQFLNTMRTVAQTENLKFIDGSAKTGADLKTMGADKLLKSDPAHAINVAIEGEKGMGVTAGNLGLPPYQVALGFTAGSDMAKARRLSDRLVHALAQQWHVATVPQGKGAFPLEGCKGDAERK